MDAIEKRARELLAAHYDRAGPSGVAEGVRAGAYDGEPEMMALIQAMAEIPVDREADRARYPDPAFNRWLDQSVTESGEYSVWHMLRSVHDAHSGWSSAADALTPPEGYVLVPVEPTEAMMSAAGVGAESLRRHMWRLMIAARPEVP